MRVDLAGAAGTGSGVATDAALVPGGVGRQDQRRDLAGRGARRLHRGRRIARRRRGRLHGAHPGRHAARPAFGVGGQRRVERPVIGRLVADDVDDAALRAPRVVQIGQAVGQARAAMQQRARRLARPCASSRRPCRSRRSPAGRARSACPGRGRAPRRNASRWCRDWRSRCRRPTRAACGPGFQRRSMPDSLSLGLFRELTARDRILVVQFPKFATAFAAQCARTSDSGTRAGTKKIPPECHIQRIQLVMSPKAPERR